MLLKEYRICMPLNVEEYRVGQLYMIAKHSHEQSEGGDGIEVVCNESCESPEFGKGQFTEKRIYLSSKVPYYFQRLIPRFFYVTEKAWNYYPFTITEYTCSFLPRFSVSIKTKFENNNGSSENCFNLPEESLDREVDFIDIVEDDYPIKHYKIEEDLTSSECLLKGRGPLSSGWRSNCSPVMCSYKLVDVKYAVWGLQTRVENFIQSSIRQVLLVGHRQAVAWIDEWYDMDIDTVRVYERNMNEKTNIKVNRHSSACEVGSMIQDLPHREAAIVES